MQNTHSIDFAALDRELGFGMPSLDLDVTPLESLEAPAWWQYAAGLAGGVAVGYGTVGLIVWT